MSFPVPWLPLPLPGPVDSSAPALAARVLLSPRRLPDAVDGVEGLLLPFGDLVCSVGVLYRGCLSDMVGIRYKKVGEFEQTMYDER